MPPTLHDWHTDSVPITGKLADRETGATSRFGVFTGGDVVTGPDTVVTAMVAGRKAAYTIDAYLG